jgi:O-antigen/teichoic acid export membrane protein
VRRQRLERIDAAPIDWRTMLSFSAQASLAVSFTIVMMSLDRVLLGYFRPRAEVGIYHAAAQLSSVFPMVVGAFGAIFGPMIVGCHGRGERQRLAELFAVCTKWGLYLTVPMFLLIVFRAPEMLAVVYQPSYRAGHGALTVLAAGQLVNAATGPVGLVLIMTGHQRAWFTISGLALALNLALDFALIPIYGGLGAAVATAVAVAAAFSIASVVAWRRLGVRPFDRRFGKIVVATAVASGALGIWSRFGVAAGWLGVAGPGLLAGLVFLAVIALFPTDPEEKQWLGVVVERLRRSARGGRS